MLQLLQPIWLYAMAGIIIPVLIHLWNMSPGKTLLVGSIALMQENSRQQSRRVKLTDWFLLLLRCLLIILLALLLSKPVWQRRPVNNEKGWVLMEPSHINETYQQFQPLIDSLLQAGYTFHYLQPGFREVRLPAALEERGDTLADTTSYWALVAALQQQRANNRAVYLFTPNYLHRFEGLRPVIDTGIHWYAYTPKDSVATWTAGAYQTDNGTIRVRQVSSNPGGTYYTYEENRSTLPADTTTSHLVIFADTYTQDAHYLQAALNAIQQFTRRKMEIAVVHETTALPPAADWLFWLSAKPLPAGISAHNILQYDSGKVVNTTSWLLTENAPPLALYKSIAVQDTAATLWRDGAGHAVLRLEKRAAGSIYHFSSRLDPAWNELPWSPAFPAMLLPLLFPDSITVKDKRAIAIQQLAPDTDQQAVVRRAGVSPVTKDLSTVCWIAIVILFLAERLWVLRTQKILAHG